MDAQCSCSEILTRWIPSAEVELVAPAPIEGVELAMEKLAALPDTAAAKAGLSALVTRYRDWITRQNANVPGKPKRRKETGAELLSRAAVAANRIEAGRAEPVDGQARRTERKTRAERGDAGDIQALLGFWRGAAQDNVIHVFGGDAGGAFQCGFQDFGGQIIGPGLAEGAFRGFANRRARGGYNYNFFHCVYSIVFRTASMTCSRLGRAAYSRIGL